MRVDDAGPLNRFHLHGPRLVLVKRGVSFFPNVECFAVEWVPFGVGIGKVLKALVQMP